MSVMNFQTTFRDVKPPEKGSFPLDHEGEQLQLTNCTNPVTMCSYSTLVTSTVFLLNIYMNS